MHLIVARQSVGLTGPIDIASLVDKYAARRLAPLLRQETDAIEATLDGDTLLEDKRLLVGVQAYDKT